MNRIYLRILLLIAYLGVIAYVLYPTGSRLSDEEGLRWLLTMGGTLLIILVLFLLLHYRKQRRERYTYGYYDDQEQEGKSPKQ